VSTYQSNTRLKDEEKVCSCGCGLKRINEITSCQYDIIPAQFRVIENVRFTCTCSSKCGAKPVKHFPGTI